MGRKKVVNAGKLQLIASSNIGVSDYEGNNTAVTYVGILYVSYSMSVFLFSYSAIYQIQ